MKSKYTIPAVILTLIAAVVLTGLYFSGGQRLVPSVSAQSPGPQQECEQLRSRADDRFLECYALLARSSDPLISAEGFWGLGDLNSANAGFQAWEGRVKAGEAQKAPGPLVRWGYLFMATDLNGEAVALFQEALELDANYVPALLAMARVLANDFDPAAADFAKKAIEADPKAYQANEILAWIHLEDNDPDAATEEAKKAIAVNPNASQALAILATIDQMDDKPGTQWLDRIKANNPKDGEAYETMAHFFVINRRYDEGIELYREALRLRPDLWTARAQLGVNLMRFGQDDEARRELVIVFEKGPNPSQVIVRNTLKLLDSYEQFETRTTPTTVLKVDKKEAALVGPYFQAELDRAMSTYEKKYKYKIQGPVRVEVYPNHPDFEVRTMGLPGLGALGVTFGKVVAMDSPSSRPPGDFHWAATLWHELSHVYVLSMTNHRVPRWFTEGLAVYEESAINPEWADRMTPREVLAIKGKKLLPIADLDRGFIHPSYPEQVIVSYFQGGQVLTFIIDRWSFEAVLGMIEGFKERKDTVTVVREVLKIDPEEFDRQFLAWLGAKEKKTIDGFDEWKSGMQALAQVAEAQDWDKVIAQAPKLIEIYPDFVMEGASTAATLADQLLGGATDAVSLSAYSVLTRAYLAKNDKANAIKTLEAYAAHGGRAPDALKKLGDLQIEAGNKQAAAAALQKLNFIFLKDDTAHQKLGGLYMDLGNPKGAVLEYGAVIGGGTVDPAGANYNLARAYHAAGQDLEAMSAVFKALEAAPGYKPAQKLLLELSVK